MRATVRQLSALDAAFLYGETVESPMHVGSLAMVARPADSAGDLFAAIRTLFATRVNDAPSLLLKLAQAAFEIDRPSWIQDDAFDLDRHVLRGELSEPATELELHLAVAELHSKLLDRTRPLWEVYVFPHAGNGTGAIYTKIHHALVDGGAGTALARVLYDATPVPRDPAALATLAPDTVAKRSSAPEDVSGAALAELWRAPFRSSHELKEFTLPRTGRSDFSSVLVDAAMNAAEWNVRMAAHLPDVVAAMAGSAERELRPDVAQLRSLSAPSTRLNASITAGRSFATLSLPLDRIKTLGTKAGGKVNDVVLALTAGMLRSYLTDLNGLPAQTLTAFVPISTRETGDARMKNQTYGMTVPLSTNVADPVARLTRIISQAKIAKELAGPFKGFIPHFMDAPTFATPMIFQLVSAYSEIAKVADTTTPQSNVVVSNVMLSKRPLYIAGEQITHVYPLSIVTHGQAVNVTVQGYGDWLDFGIMAATNVVPDPLRLAELLSEAFAELELAYQTMPV